MEGSRSRGPTRGLDGARRRYRRPRGLALLWTQLDLDGDGLAAHREVALGTDPFRADTDRDRLDDGWETRRALDPLSADTDADTLGDRAELLNGTDPREGDSDDDRIEDPRELVLGTNPTTSDTDGDELGDGYEADVAGTDPLQADSDGDALDDARELELAANPWAADTDNDHLPDAVEARNGTRDCNGNGVPAIADADDDGDGRPDGDEGPAHRCDPDVDGDGIPDGEEGNPVCVARPDCDIDGLRDGTERDTEFDRLDPDTFDVGLLDSVSWTFQARGQPTSRDDDGDGIPDRWEQTTGLIEWGPFDPEPGRIDMLVEFVRVTGPDSLRYGPGPLPGPSQRVETFFETEGGISFQWVSTPVHLDAESRPPLIPSSLSSYYEKLLAEAEHSTNPYVTTMVLNPQHDASEIAHLGVAPIRGMLGAIDYGAHSKVRFRVGEQTFTVSPFIESLVVADRQDALQAMGYLGGGRQPDGDLFVRTQDWTMSWRPFWFATAPTFTFDDGNQVQAERVGVEVDEAELAFTIAHEFGHTLGLCHTHLPECRRNLAVEDRTKAGVSTMDYGTSGSDLEFLPSEWEQVHTYISCPPQRSIRLLAEGAGDDAVLASKYAVTLENVLDVDVRACQDYTPIEATMIPLRDPYRWRAPVEPASVQLETTPTTYALPVEDAPPVPAGRATDASVTYTVASVGTAMGSGALAAVVLRRRGW